jgi:hypothetical protein
MTRPRSAMSRGELIRELDADLAQLEARKDPSLAGLIDTLRAMRRNLSALIVPPDGAGTIGEAWASYSAALLDPIGADAVQREETKRAFYGGAAATFGIMLEAAELEEDAAAARVEALDLELADFLRLFSSRHGITS